MKPSSKNPIALVFSLTVMSALAALSVCPSRAKADAADDTPSVAVAPQYDTTHVYVAPEDVDRFAASFLATFGGHSTKQVIADVTPTPSRTTSQLLQTPVGTVSLFGYKTPIPYPFGVERTGFLVADMDEAVRAARATGADVLVENFPDPIGRDAIIQWPGGVNTQLYWHTTPPHYAALQTVPENRVYVSAERAADFIHSFIAFSHGKVVKDEPNTAGDEIGRPGYTFREIRIESNFGKMAVLVTDGHNPYPYGRELTGYEVADLPATLTNAQAAGAKIIIQPYHTGDRDAVMVEFPGGYIAEIHSSHSTN
jgi:predicted enzyme related to lactoylglutathione lyase